MNDELLRARGDDPDTVLPTADDYVEVKKTCR
jgi:hypothetical protein